MKKFEIWCVLRNETPKGNILVCCKTLILIQASKLEKVWSAVPFWVPLTSRLMARSGPKKATASISLA